MDTFKIRTATGERLCHLLADLTTPDSHGIPSSGDEHLLWYESGTATIGVLLDGPTLNVMLDSAQDLDWALQTLFIREWIQDLGWCEAGFPEGQVLDCQDFERTLELLASSPKGESACEHLWWMSKILQDAKAEKASLRIARL